MNPTPSPAASQRAREQADKPAAEETLAAHARRALRTRVRARVTAVLDAGIAFLQGLREKAGGVREQPDETGDRHGSGSGRPGARRDAPAAADGTPVEAPRPTRRLRVFLIYLGVLLAGSIGGGALAYTLFQQQLDQLYKDSQRREAALSKRTRPSAEILRAFEDEQSRRTDRDKKLAASLATYSASAPGSDSRLESLFGEQLAENRRLQAALADQTRTHADIQKALEAEQARRAEAEKQAAGAAKSMADKQKQLDATERKLAMLNGNQGARTVQRETPAIRPGDSRRPRPLKSGNCTLDAKNVVALKGCIDDFNR